MGTLIRWENSVVSRRFRQAGSPESQGEGSRFLGAFSGAWQVVAAFESGPPWRRTLFAYSHSAAEGSSMRWHAIIRATERFFHGATVPLEDVFYGAAGGR